MNTDFRTAIACLALIGVGCTATPNARDRLTVQRVADLTAPTTAPRATAYKVEIAGIGVATLPAVKPQGRIESIREFRFPVAFDSPRATPHVAPGITPLTPTAFETVNTGLTIRLSAKPHGRLIAIYGIVDDVEFVGFDDGGYGAVAGPIYTEQGDLISPNKLQQPRFHTMSSRFHVFALPGEPYDVTLYYGGKAMKHKVIVTAK